MCICNLGVMFVNKCYLLLLIGLTKRTKLAKLACKEQWIIPLKEAASLLWNFLP